ncbi:TetR/AcrR family transcriptional regulator [Microbaculum marinum]|uniref:TetR/AcrR family transcriptional regulator n=1 Tax=Microbaculum marinum TaxID=1764581 RepID=A0AAW9RT29_9HYPH
MAKKTTRQTVEKTARSTEERLLDTAELMFSKYGYSGVSLRMISEAASANSAAIHYYFRSKQGLLRAVMARRCDGLNAERMAMLDECEREAVDGIPDIAKVVTAFVAPVVRLGKTPGEKAFKEFYGFTAFDPNPEVREIVKEFFDPFARRFVDMISRARPDLSREELFFRLSLIYGTLGYVRANPPRLREVLGDDLSFADGEKCLHFVIPALVAGMAFPPVGPMDGGD